MRTLCLAVLLVGCEPSKLVDDTGAVLETGEESDTDTDTDSDSDTDSDTDTDTDADLELLLSPNPNNPMAARASVTTPTDCTVSISAWADGRDQRRTVETESGTLHTIDVIELNASTDWSLQARALCADDNLQSDIETHRTGPIPNNVPPLTASAIDASAMAEGLTFFAPGSGDPADAPVYLAVDETGEVVWTYFDPTATGGRADFAIEPVGTDKLMLLMPDRLRVITLGGETVAEVTPADAGISSFHHDGHYLSDGGWVVMSSGTQSVMVDGRQAQLDGDVLYELEPDGTVRFEWNSFDHLDTQDLPDSSYGSSIDWTHGNALAVYEAQGFWIYSARAMNLMFKIDRASGQVDWSIGPDSDFDLLTGDWFYSAHAPELHADGSFLVYDNGNDRPGGSPYSRAVRYELDETDLVAAEVWQYRVPEYTGRLGDANLLDNGNVLVCAGGPDAGSPATLYEASEAGDTLWTLQVDDFLIYRAERIPRHWNQ